MNPLLAKLHPYPFERLRALTQNIQPNKDFKAINGLDISHGSISHGTHSLRRAITFLSATVKRPFLKV